MDRINRKLTIENNFQLEIRISWLHEFNPTFDTEKYTLEGDTNILRPICSRKMRIC